MTGESSAWVLVENGYVKQLPMHILQPLDRTEDEAARALADRLMNGQRTMSRMSDAIIGSVIRTAHRKDVMLLCELLRERMPAAV
jgi:hypothetical protein